MKRILAVSIILCLLFSAIPRSSALIYDGAHTLVLSSVKTDSGYRHSATLDGSAVEEYDYTWHADPGEAHSDVKNAPAEYYTGTKPDTDAAAYIAHDIYYYPELPTDSFKKVQYDGEQEWAYYYTADGYTDYIFATLPVSGGSVPASMMHSEEEAYENAVLHITQAGTYILKGEWHGQIWIDLGDTDDTFADESAKVTIILNGVDVTCTAAPALVFYSVYECDNTWKDQSSWSCNVDTTGAGANVIIADGTVNSFTGENIYRMLKTTYKDGQEGRSVPVQKKMRKLDGAFYSYVSMNIDGEKNGTGVLNITSGFEGLDTELHLTINGGNINILSQDDGINVNEDGVSVVTINGGSTHILAGLGSEGDGIDSNGYLVVNGGTVIALAKPNSDSGMDSDSGTYINGGTVVALGSAMDYARSDNAAAAGQAVMNLQFASSQSADEAIIITDTSGKVVFAYDPDKDEVAGDNARWYCGAIVSAPGLQVGGSYYVYVGGDVTGTESEGVYEAATVTGFSSDAKQQSYRSIGSLGGPGGGFGGRGERENGERGEFRPDMSAPDGTEDGFRNFPAGQDWAGRGNREGFGPQDGTPPSGMPDGQMPQGGFATPPDAPDNQPPQGDFEGTVPPDMPDGQPPQDNSGGQNQGGDTASGTGTITFTMTDKVNNFSGVTDYSGDASTDGSGSPTAPETSGPVRPQQPAAAPGNFSDVDSGAWYRSAVDYVSANGLMTGTSNTEFSPSAAMTRAMVWTVLGRMAGADADGSGDPWYAKAQAWASASGVSDGSNPNGGITREELVTMIWRSAGSPTASADLAAFSDSGSVSSWAGDAMLWAVANGILSGDNGSLKPSAFAARAEVAAILMRFRENTVE